MFLYLLELWDEALSKKFLHYIWVCVIATYWESMNMGVGEEMEKKKKEKVRRRLQEMGTMCQVVNELGHMFDTEMGKVLSDSGIIGAMWARYM